MLKDSNPLKWMSKMTFCLLRFTACLFLIVSPYLSCVINLIFNLAFAQQPVDYKVEKLRDGKSFCARYVKGVQNDQVVFAGIANFSKVNLIN